MGKTFLDWSDVKVQPHFWTRLFEAIGEPGKYIYNSDTDSVNRKLSETFGEPDRTYFPKDNENEEQDSKITEKNDIRNNGSLEPNFLNRGGENSITKDEQNKYAKFENLDENENADYTMDIKGTYVNKIENGRTNNGSVLDHDDDRTVSHCVYDEVFIDEANKHEDFYKDTDIIITV